MEAKFLIDQGSRWRVGDGRSIRVWRDRWTPDQFYYRTPLPPGNAEEDLRVSSLLEDDGLAWNHNKIRSTFSTNDVKAILSIPVSW